jgi:hypothetical protein
MGGHASRPVRVCAWRGTRGMLGGVRSRRTLTLALTPTRILPTRKKASGSLNAIAFGLCRRWESNPHARGPRSLRCPPWAPWCTAPYGIPRYEPHSVGAAIP